MQAGITAPPVWINGERGASPDARDRGLAFGDGLFETMRFGPAGVYLLAYHLRRLELGASRLRMSLDPSLLRAEI